MKNIIFVAALTFVLGLTNVAWANPTELDLTFIYRSNGTLKADVSFDRKVKKKCKIVFRTALYYEGDEATDRSVKRTNAFVRTYKKNRKTSSLRASRLPGVVKVDGQDPILAVQARLTCPNNITVDSNIEARFVKCGANTRRVSTKEYLQQLKKSAQ